MPEQLSGSGELVVSLLKRSQPVKSYTDRRVSEVDLQRIIEAIRWTPSAANLQPWEIMLLAGAEAKGRVTKATLDPMMRSDESDRQDWIALVPHVMVLFGDTRRVRARFGESADRIVQQDVAAAAMSAILTATALGIASCRVYEFDPELLREELGVPRFFTPVAVVTLGYSDSELALPPTLDPSLFTHEETW